jgi:hypothetical protein
MLSPMLAKGMLLSLCVAPEGRLMWLGPNVGHNRRM